MSKMTLPIPMQRPTTNSCPRPSTPRAKATGIEASAIARPLSARIISGRRRAPRLAQGTGLPEPDHLGGQAGRLPPALVPAPEAGYGREEVSKIVVARQRRPFHPDIILRTSVR